MTQDRWLKTHAYLEPVAFLHAQVNGALADGSTTRPRIPCWEHYVAEFLAGVPLLHSYSVAVELEPAEEAIAALVGKLVSKPLPGKLPEQTRKLDTELRSHPDAPRQVVRWLLGADDAFTAAYAGLLRYVGWSALSRYLRPLTDAFGSWRDEERWLRSYCPTCGSPPAMAQLVGTDPGRRRFLSCGHCGTRWWYRRTGCPFCESENDDVIAVLTFEGEGGLRIDHCQACGGYLKTYDGEGSENVLLADWTSIHLDVIARDRGLRRIAASLYEL
jgi:FdhE protein